jgi:hypothetical protein
MEEPVDGVLGRDAELAEVESFIGSALGPPSCLLLEDPPGSARRRCGTQECPSLGHEVIGSSLPHGGTRGPTLLRGVVMITAPGRFPVVAARFPAMRW